MNLKIRSRKNKKKVALMVSLYAILLVTVGVTLSFLFVLANPVENTFTPGEVTTTVVEDFNGETKANVKIQNTGNVEAYIRAAVVVTWQDQEGNVYAGAPKVEEDYRIVYNLSDSGWIKGADGFYYWINPVKSDDEDEKDCTTGILITSCVPVEEETPDGYTLHVEIIGSGIQADGITSEGIPVVVEEWASGVSGLNGTTLVIK